MKRSITLVCALYLLFSSLPAQEQPAIEMLGDRTIIYPGRLDLHGDETLMDILQLVPDLLIGGYDNLLGS